ncbi:alpha-ketoglutarate-dependent dioxygenase AlkB [Vibrio sp. ZSDZ34]|uniref:Alpha-ketoglutarate-dependent dioxygenase AlkB n=1 Tax=Vibrio gelatinilyticus TaxID=2893468 RepID=A0A9X1WCE2_9VIBR|nr:alpha-ketoglutarate-dependent dioxygenase AlkB [Vibrio gelatinilyticus]MCJ2377704.1 alpha-ketoglutarate-dependent dioxygenase AlkB [Vibrio gelatinilyticus]
MISRGWNEVPNGRLFWMPDFISADEAQSLFLALRQDVEWRQDHIQLFGKSHPIPRLQAWYGEKPYRYSNLLMSPKPWLPLLLTLKQRCEQVAHSEFNSVLVNLYRDGKDSNSWHSDNEPELGEKPTIASLSLGEARTFHLKHKKTKQKITLELTPGSLLIMSDDTQRYWQHYVPKTRLVKQERINLTFRYVYES